MIGILNADMLHNDSQLCRVNILKNIFEGVKIKDKEVKSTLFYLSQIYLFWCIHPFIVCVYFILCPH